MTNASEFAKDLGLTMLAGLDTAEQLNALAVASSEIGGYPLTALQWIKTESSIGGATSKAGSEIAARIKASGLPSSLVLSALSEFKLNELSKKTNGVYFTDSRLSEFLASQIAGDKKTPPTVIDPACGSGMLLSQAALRLNSCGISMTKVLADCIFGADLSQDSVRAAIIALSSMTDSASTVKRLCSHLTVGDSLRRSEQSWRKLSENGFDYVIANPPWERLRTVSHEITKSIDSDRHYGDSITEDLRLKIESHRKVVSAYSASVGSSAKLQGDGERDMYKLFLELSMRLRNRSGMLCVLVPAGLIRAANAVDLREELVSKNSGLHFVLFDNKDRYFDIDSRFKFLAVFATRNDQTGDCPELVLSVGCCIDAKVRIRQPIKIRTKSLRVIRPDLTIPEVRSTEEWKLFQRLSASHKAFGEASSLWRHRYVREVDMTLSRKEFKTHAGKDCVPLIEGRMIHQFRFGCKAYASGTGRKATWSNASYATAPKPVPQFFISIKSLSPSRQACLAKSRAGFCDITGQTNERTVLAAIIPAGVICGNKVPTIMFEDSGLGEKLKYAWVGVANSFCFDWLTRLVCTTSLNFFILDSIPVPDERSSLPVILEIAGIVEQFAERDKTRVDGIPCRERATIEALVLRLYGMSAADAQLVLSTFPQVDKCQHPLPGEAKSTITADCVMDEYYRLAGDVASRRLHVKRLDNARRQGAQAFMPNQFTK
jgi:Alw26I/Eco31I/Esp3I family type II restriction m6 adenine DNA methyltransferase